jgi:putative NIF3 family GTP cyclohydrolase 1 type 2
VVCPGSFDESWIPLLTANQIDVLVTGELKHHVALQLAARGIAALEAGHDVSERVVLPRLAEQLKIRHPEISFAVHAGLDYNKIAF